MTKHRQLRIKTHNGSSNIIPSKWLWILFLNNCIFLDKSKLECRIGITSERDELSSSVITLQEELLELHKNQEENKNKEDLLQKKEENEVSPIYTFSYDRNPLYKK